MVPLMEETRADVCSALESIEHAPSARVVQIQEDRPLSEPSDFSVWFQEDTPTPSAGCYYPKDDDVLLLTTRKPTHLSDLEQPCAIAIVRGETETKNATQGTAVAVRLLSGSLPLKQHGGRENVIALPLFAIFLINDKTAKRIVDALSLQTRPLRDISLINKIAEYDPRVCK